MSRARSRKAYVVPQATFASPLPSYPGAATQSYFVQNAPLVKNAPLVQNAPLIGGPIGYPLGLPLGSFGGSIFTFRQKPVADLDAGAKEYRTWLLGVIGKLQKEDFKAPYAEKDPYSQTIGAIEAYILAYLATIGPISSDIIRNLTSEEVNVFKGVPKFQYILHPDLRPYIIRPRFSWPSAPLLQNVALTDAKDIEIATKFNVIVNAVSVEIGNNSVIDSKTSPKTASIVNERLLSALYLLEKAKKVINTSSETFKPLVDDILGWSKRAQMVSPRVATYFQRNRYTDKAKDAFVDITTPTASTVRPIIYVGPGYGPSFVYGPRQGGRPKLFGYDQDDRELPKKKTGGCAP